MLLAVQLGHHAIPAGQYGFNSDPAAGVSSARTIQRPRLGSSSYRAPTPRVEAGSSTENAHIDEQLSWQCHQLVWTRGSQVFRRFTYEHEGEEVSYALFACLAPADLGERLGAGAPDRRSDDTFGPFHHGQDYIWGSARRTSRKGKRKEDGRCLVVFLKTRAYIYYPNGEDVVVHLPFQVDRAWALERGILVQRKLERREERRFAAPQARRRGGTSVLDEVVDLDEGDELPRLYTLDNPFDEFKVVVEGREHEGRLVEEGEGLDASCTVVFVSETQYPFLLSHDRDTGEITFYRRVLVPVLAYDPQPERSPRTMHPDELLRQPDPPPATRPRPSLNRNPSTFAATTATDRRISSAADPLDRTTRRAPRLSRGPDQAGELQAALEPAPLPTMSVKQPRKSGALSIEQGRRASGAGLSMRDVGDVRLGDRDMRETTMMMGLERAEGARSDVVLEKIWSWTPPEAVISEDIHVFTSDNVSADNVVLNLHIHHTLYAFSATLASQWVITPLYALPCLSAIPLIATRHVVLDTLILTPQHTFNLVTSFGETISVSVPPLATTSGRDELPGQLANSLSMVLDEDEPMQPHEGVAPIRLEVIAGSRFTVVYENGETQRMSADWRVKDDLTRRCVEALSFALSRERFYAFKRELLVRIQQIEGLQKGDGQELFRCFADTVRSMLGISLSSTRGGLQPIDEAQTSQDPIVRRLAKLCRSRHVPPTPRPLAPVCGNALDPSDAAPILLALHLVAQDSRLSSGRRSELLDLAPLILDLASWVGRRDWWDWWARLMPSFAGSYLRTDHRVDTSILDRYIAPPDILIHLSLRLRTRTKPFPTPRSISSTRAELGAPDPTAQLQLVCEIFDKLGPSPGKSLSARAADAIGLIVRRKLGDEWLSDLPVGVATPILEMIRICQHSPERDWPVDLYEFVGRRDLGMQARGLDVPSNDALPEDSEEMPTVGGIMSSIADTAKAKLVQPNLPHVRFGSDRRVREVERIMQTTKLRVVPVQDPKNVPEAEIAQYHQNVVNTLANRTLSIPVGQGIFEYGTRPLRITDQWPIPVIELSVKVSPANTTLQAQIVAENADWPCFHNGVAAGLAIDPKSRGVDSSWIVFNRPHTLNPEHGGFLLGLGLTGHLRSLLTYHAFPYMEPRHDFTSVGLLLGMGCAYAGSEDLLITKVLSLHTHALLPLGSMELNASPLIQSSAMLGLGLVYAGTRNLRMAEVALGEVGRKDMPGVDGFGEHAESYSFSSAMAFGLIMLGRGGKVDSEVDRRLLGGLRRCIAGDNIASPGATLALGLMYLKSGRRDIADTLAIPQSTFELEHVRPDLLLLRTFARGLIMWDDVAPSMAWIESNLPPFIHAQHKGHKRSAGMELNTEMAYLHIIAGAGWAIGLKYAGTATELAHTNLLFFYGVLTKAAAGQSMTYEGRIRRTAARQALNIVAISLSVVMSGTGELNVLRRLRVSHGQEGAGVTYGSHMAMHMALGILFLGRGYYTLGTSNLAIAAMAIAFFPRFLPTPGDNKAYPQAFRHLWALAVEPRCLAARDVDTGETIYLPVKVRLHNGKQQSLISPTLIAPFENIASIEVESPRYWPIKYDLSIPADRESLVKTRTIHVQRKAGFLDYQSDPKGNRSIFVRAGSMTHFDMHYDLVSPAAPPGVSADETEELMALHMGIERGTVELAKRFRGDTEVERFTRAVMLECVSLDKPRVLSVYLKLLEMMLGDKEMMGMEGVGMVELARSFYRVWEKEAENVKRPPLIRASFLTSLLKRLLEGDVGDEAKRGYLESGAGLDTPGNGLELAKWIKREGVPCLEVLEGIGERVKADTRNGKAVEMRIRDAVEAYGREVARAWTVEGDGDVDESWKSESIHEAMRVWRGVA